MSHVWGQTVPSNYGRLPATRQKVFNSIKTEIVGEQVQTIGKKAIKKIQAKTLKEVREELGEKLGKNLTPEVNNRVMKETLQEVGEDASPEVLEKAFKKNLKEAGQKSGKDSGQGLTVEAVQEGTQDNVDELLKNAPETVKERLGMRALTVGGAGLTAYAMFGAFINSDAVNDYVASSTGRDCDEKAVEAGYEPGTQEYTDNVSACQEEALENMAFLGKAITYGGIGIGALIAVSILGKLGIFSGSGSSDDEE